MPMKKALLPLVALATGGALAVPALASSRGVSVGPGTSFGPRAVTIARGDSLRFRWTGHKRHNVVVVRGPQRFRTAVHGPGTTITKRFTRAGSYVLVCTLHEGMRLSLRVR
jgi:plastocyanin